MNNLLSWARIGQGPLIGVILGLGALMSVTDSAYYLTRLGMDFTVPWALSDDAVQRPVDPNIAMVVVDEKTHRTPPFDETPEVAWTPYLAKALTAVDAAGAAVIGVDIIFPKTLSGLEALRGYDRPFLQALYKLGRAGRLVLGETRLSEDVIEPYEGQIQAIGGRNNVSPLQFKPDEDGIVRQYVARSALEGEAAGSVYSFANELAARASRATLSDDFLINFVSPGAVPTYRLSDVVACAEDEPEGLSDLFKDRLVLFGYALDVEDRHMATSRFKPNNQPRVISLSCAGNEEEAAVAGVINRQSVPGVYIHARALQTVLHQNSPIVISPLLSFVVTLVLLGLLAFLFLRVPALYGFVFLLAILGFLWLAAVALMSEAIVVPYLVWGLAAALSYVLLYTYRVFFEDQQKRWIRHAFQHYLSPELVDQLAAEPESLKLGGEERHIAILFLDLAGFTRATEELAERPEHLVAELNRYLASMADIIESHGGYVDKFIGDAVMAIWGAPVAIADKEGAAARAALACQHAIKQMNTKIERQGEQPLIQSMRIGLNSGSAIVGNMGSEHRFNYTAVGDAVNLAARLESANKTYGTEILAGEAFAEKLSVPFEMREVDYVVVQGKTQPVHIFEIIGAQAGEATQSAEDKEKFEAALALYRAQQFETAEQEFAKLAQDDPVAALYHERARDKQHSPPRADWDGSEILTGK